jgi:uncharacterized protein YegJ (DUF2314 family)
MFPILSPKVLSAGCAMVLGAAIAVCLGPNQLSAQTVTRKAERDEIAIVAQSDPVMAAAMGKARATLQNFLALSATPKPNTESYAVKVAIHDGNDAEYFWITPFTNKNGAFSGEVNNTPRMVHTVKLGQTIMFGEDDIVDWMYYDGDKMKGNYTACALLKSAPGSEVEEFKRRFGLDCDF